MTGIVSVAGIALVAVALWDVFHTLWHPSGQGALSDLLVKAVWKAARHGGPRTRELAGPIALATVIGSWLGLVLLGGALVSWPHLPDEFSYSPGLSPTRGTEFTDAVYLSIVTTATLGFGDIVPTSSWLRIVIPVQALISFGLLTAAVTWLLQLYPALTRRRVLSLQIATLRDAGLKEMIETGATPAGARLLEGVAQGLTQVRVDFTQYTETFYFAESNPDANLASTIHHALDLADAAQQAPSQELRMAGAVLARSLDSLAARLDEFLGTGKDTGAVLEAYTQEVAGGQRSPR